MATKVTWTPENVTTLLSCRNSQEMQSAFPGVSISNLQRRAREFRVNSSTVFEPSPLDIYGPLFINTDQDMVPRSLLTKALRERDAAKDKSSEIVSAVRSSVLEAAQSYVISPLKPYSSPSSNDTTEEIAVLDIADWQIGKTSPSYNTDVATERVQLLGEKVKKIIEVQRADHPVNEIHIRALGDLVEGEGIFKTQAHQIDSSLYRQIFATTTMLTNLILDMLEVVEKVHFVGVIGNHGQIRLANGSSDPESNMDRLVYKTVQQVLMGPDRLPNQEIRNRVTWNIPEGKGESNWYAIDRIFDWGHLLCHGDQIRGGFAGFPFYGTAKKAGGWIDSIDEPWDELHFGHWHTPTMQTLNLRRAICCGSLESDNLYAQEQLGAIGLPTQWLGFVHPKYHVTASYWVDLSENGREPNLMRGMRWAGNRNE